MDVVYRPPSSNIHYLINLCKQLESIKKNYLNSTLWIAGNFNFQDINWDDNFVENYAYP